MIGETFGNYRLVVRLGSGAMGTVFLGEHERIARRAAIKVLAPQFAEDGDILRRFFDEARATSIIHHPAIVEVLDCGVHPDGRRPYIVMDHLHGETLARRLERRGTLPWPEACAIARQIAEGLDAAHGHRIIHRDVKPANVMLVVGPEARLDAPPSRVKLLDFGVAKLLQDTQSKSLTHPGQLLGTPEYMAPEQCSGGGPIDERTDVYALGCVLFEMVSGRPPFVCKSLSELILAHQWREAPAASAHAELPPALDRLIGDMLSKRREDRPAEMTSVIDALGRLLEGTRARDRDSVAPSIAPPRPSVALPTRALAVTAGLLAVVAVSLAVRVAVRSAHRARRPIAVERSSPARGSASAPPPVVAPAFVLAPAPAPPPRTSPSAPPSARSPSPRAPISRRARASEPPEIDVDGIVDL